MGSNRSVIIVILSGGSEAIEENHRKLLYPDEQALGAARGLRPIDGFLRRSALSQSGVQQPDARGLLQSDAGTWGGSVAVAGLVTSSQ